MLEGLDILSSFMLPGVHEICLQFDAIPCNAILISLTAVQTCVFFFNFVFPCLPLLVLLFVLFLLPTLYFFLASVYSMLSAGS